MIVILFEINIHITNIKITTKIKSFYFWKGFRRYTSYPKGVNVLKTNNLYLVWINVIKTLSVSLTKLVYVSIKIYFFHTQKTDKNL